MTVYVDNMRAAYGRMKMSHMIADTREELVVMADRIGVDRRHIQYPDTYREHFDVCVAKRAMAILFGAKPVTTREMAIIRKRKKEEPTP